jgi:soluble lytic murein transglycosylase
VIAAGADAALVREARWRLAWGAYEDGRWDNADAAFAELGRASAQDEAAATYWQGRIRDRRDGAGAGAPLYRAVVDQAPDTYYAELSEARLLETAPPPPAPLPLSGEPPESLTAHAYHWSRSRELHAIGLDEDAARELAAIGDDPTLASDAETFLLEAYREVDAHRRALRLADRLATANAVPRATLAAYLYPLAYWPRVSGRADWERLDPYLVLALMRQESLFDPEAVSPAAAYGLMQLIAPTAEKVAGRPVAATELTDPRLNVELGTRYLRQLLDRYGELPKALAAYNAGEDAVAKWDARAPGSASDEFVERISFRETRNYVKSVLGNYRRYRRLYGAPGEHRATPLDATDGR